MFIIAMFLVGFISKQAMEKRYFSCQIWNPSDYFFIVVFKRKMGLAVKRR